MPEKRTITMTSKEINRAKIAQMAIERRITQREAARRVGVSERQFRRILKSYREGGDEGLISGHRNRPGNHRLAEITRRQILDELLSTYQGFGPTLASEKLAERAGILISKETVRKIMIAEGLHKPKTKRKERVFQLRERRSQRGELVQVDGSYHAWLEDRAEKACLLLFVDDATGEILAGSFVEHESFLSYAKLCKQYFRQIGLPTAFYSDKHSVFRVNQKQATTTNALTQFGRAMKELQVEIICANTPQAKGRIERINKTLQDRLVKEMRLQGICSYEKANAFLPQYIQCFNQQFAVQPRSSLDAHRSLDPDYDLDLILSWQETRLLSKDLQVQFNKTVYQIHSNRPAYALQQRKVLIARDCSGELSIRLNGALLDFSVFHEQPKQSQVVSSKDLDRKVSRIPHSPALDHPWRTYGKKINGKPLPVPD